MGEGKQNNRNKKSRPGSGGQRVDVGHFSDYSPEKLHRHLELLLAEQGQSKKTTFSGWCRLCYRSWFMARSFGSATLRDIGTGIIEGPVNFSNWTVDDWRFYAVKTLEAKDFQTFLSLDELAWHSLLRLDSKKDDFKERIAPQIGPGYTFRNGYSKLPPAELAHVIALHFSKLPSLEMVKQYKHGESMLNKIRGRKDWKEIYRELKWDKTPEGEMFIRRRAIEVEFNVDLTSSYARAHMNNGYSSNPIEIAAQLLVKFGGNIKEIKKTAWRLDHDGYTKTAIYLCIPKLAPEAIEKIGTLDDFLAVCKLVGATCIEDLHMMLPSIVPYAGQRGWLCDRSLGMLYSDTIDDDDKV